MQFLIWGGAAVTVIGVIGLLFVALKAASAKRSAGSEDELRASIARILPWNLAALFLGTIGLMMVMAGIALS